MGETIRTNIQLLDNFSPALKGMNNSLRIVINTMLKMQTQLTGLQTKAGKPIDLDVNTKDLTVARMELNKSAMAINQLCRNTSSATRGMTSGYNSATNAIKRMNSEASKHATTQNLLWTKAKQLAAAYAGIEGLGNLIRTSDELTNINARLNIIKDDVTDIKELEAMVFKAANNSRSAYVNTAQAVARIGMNAGNAFESTKEIVAFTELMNKQFVIGGANLEEQRSAMIQLTQAMGSGVLRGEELNSVFESSPMLVKYIADYMDVPIGKIREVAAEGLITADVIKNAMFSATEEINDNFTKMKKTFTQIWQTFKNNALNAWMPLYERMREFANGSDFTDFVTKVTKAISILANATIKAIDYIDATIQYVKDNMSWIEPVFSSIVGGVLLFKSVLAIANGVLAINAFITGVATLATNTKKAAEMRAAKATFAATVAQWGLNAALLACPYVWIILAVFLLIAAFYIVIGVINQVKGTSLSATGMIAGAFMWLYAGIINGWINVYVWFCDTAEALADIAYKVAYWIYDGFFTCVEGIVNFFLKGFHEAKQGMVNFAVSVLECCVSMCQGIDSFVNALANGFIWAVNEALGAWNALIDALPGPVKSFLGLGKAELLSKSETSVTSGIQADLNGAISKAKGELGEYQPYKIDRSWDGSYEVPKIDRKWTKDDLLDKNAYYQKGYKWGEDKVNYLKNWEIFDKLGLKQDEIDDLIKGLDGVDSETDLAKYLKDKGLLGDDTSDGGAKGKSTPYSPDKATQDKLNKILGKTSEIAKNTADAYDERIEWLFPRAARASTNRFTEQDIHIIVNNDNTFEQGTDSQSVLKYLEQQLGLAVGSGAKRAFAGG